MSSWTTCRLGDICRFQAGSAFPKKYQGMTQGEIPFIKVSDMSYNANLVYIVSSTNWISKELQLKIKAKTIPEGAVVFAKIGEAVKAERYRIITRPTCIDNNMMAAIATNVHQRYFRYLLETVHLSSFIEGSALPYLRQADLLKIEVSIPSLSEQRGIAATLGALDDKIESNRRTLNILFELTNEIAKKMLSENELKVHELGELVAFNKSSIKTGQFAEIDYIDIKSVGQGNIESMIHYRFADAPSRARRMLHDGDVIYSTVRPERQAFSPIFMPEPNLIVSTGFAVMSPKEKIGTSFLTYIAGSESFAKYLASAASGSAYPAVSVSAMGKYRVSLQANTTILDLYEQMTLPMRRLGAQLLKESQQVESLRDALLPELVSGRIRVPEAQEAIDEVIPVGGENV